MKTPLCLLALLAAVTAEPCNLEHIKFVVAAPDFSLAGNCTSMNFKHGNIGDVGATALAKALETHTVVKEIDLDRNEIGDDGVRALAQALKTNPVLTELELGHNNIGDDGAVALAEALKTNTALTALDLEGNKIGVDGARALVAALKVNSVLAKLDLKSHSLDDAFTVAVADAMKVATMPGSQMWQERRRRLDAALLAAVELAAAKAAGDKAVADAGGEQEVVEKAKALGLYDHLRVVLGREKLQTETLARAVQWCADMGAKVATDLTHLRPEDMVPLVQSLGLKIPVHKQQKFADKLAAAIFKAAKDEL